MPKNKIAINVYITEEQRSYIRKKAEEQECSAAYIIRKLISREMKKDQSED